jgi:type IV secretion system protein VirB10
MTDPGASGATPSIHEQFRREAELQNRVAGAGGLSPRVLKAGFVLAGGLLLAYTAWQEFGRGRLVNQPPSTEEFAPPALDRPIADVRPPVRPPDNIVQLPTTPETPAQPPPPPPLPTQRDGPIILAPPATLPDEEALRRAEEERRRREEAERRRQERLRSTMIVASAEGAAAGAESANAARVTPPESDPNRAFAASIGNAPFEMSMATRNRRIDAVIFQGEMIPGILETAINSDLPGQVRAVTSSDVWSADGRRVLIPSGTRLVGEYRAGVARGQKRVFIVWTRLIRSDGTSVALQSFGTDALGRSGLTGYIDNKYLERFGSAILLTVAGGTAQFIGTLGVPNQDLQGPRTVTTVDPVTGAITTTQLPQTGGQQLANARQIAAQTTAQTLTTLAQEALRDSLQVTPTIHVDQGSRILVFVNRDLDFSRLYPDPLTEPAHERRTNPRDRQAGPDRSGRSSSTPGRVLPADAAASPRGVVAKP